MSGFATENATVEYRTVPAIDVNILKVEHVQSQEDAGNKYNPFNIQSIQNYQPIHSLFFNMNDNNYDTFQLNHRYHFNNMTSVVGISGEIIEKDVFIKHSPLVDPIKYMIGKYDSSVETMTNLPKLNSDKTTSMSKLLSTNNASYTDGFFSFLSSKMLHAHNFKHSIDYYGSFLTVQDKFKFNISDDYDYLNNSKFFVNNTDTLFKIAHSKINDTTDSRRNKRKIDILDDVDVVNVSDILDSSLNLSVVSDLDDISEVFNCKKKEEGSDDDSGEGSDKGSQDDSGEGSQADSGDDSDDGSEADSDDGSEEGSEEGSDDWNTDSSDSDCDDNDGIFAYIDNFPVQMICLEKCNGTMDELFERDLVNDECGASALMQVIISLLTFQKVFDFTHNDLHTNNIMFINTDVEFLYYKYNGDHYKVPTYGKLFKLIDFGRSIYKFKGHLFCSDSFSKGGDAATQYNFGPIFNSKKPTIEPNYSFDLCRLGTSIYDFIIDDEPVDKMSELQKTIYRWCLDDESRNVLYKKNGDERYPDFKLYKMIAKNVHQHTPENQLEFPYFNQFKIKVTPTGVDIIDIDAMPCYSV